MSFFSRFRKSKTVHTHYPNPSQRQRGKYGRLPAKFPPALKDFSTYLTGVVNIAPVSYPLIEFSYSMLGNGPDPRVTNQGPGFDGCGDCTLAALTHLRRANSLETNSPEVFANPNQIVAEYFQLTGGEDSGLVISDVLKQANTLGLFGNKIVGYAPVNISDLNEIKYVVSQFGAAYLGFDIPASAETQFDEGQPWSLTGTSADKDIVGGHCVPCIAYDDTYAYVVTWATIQKVEWSWFTTYLEEAWAVLTTEDAKVNLAALQADLANV